VARAAELKKRFHISALLRDTTTLSTLRFCDELSAFDVTLCDATRRDTLLEHAALCRASEFNLP
jgi:hypothetical protein